MIAINLLWLALAGAAGTVARYSLSGFALRWLGTGWPWGTFVVNAIGCFLYGLVWSLAEQRIAISPETRFVLLTGFMGAFTTFSTFAFDTTALGRDGDWLLMSLNLLANNGVGIILVLAGLSAGRLV